ncbi:MULTISPECIES: response regulator [unclassified Marinobacterium]|jgi:excisionase family DNA binding protein|uniref:response regulator n=1 Tax=unclassified Marinobacterium TaxID=2644139 RepID=UPI001569E92B|nr:MULTISPECIES: response regulator [unclassified Marinobacterium]NRP28331.1 Sporulation initiation phosphotransferase F [Marinobacterium sp. xm-d-420]NRP37248.1 Sporulation initiation phosphotransferase F [Marinobacterium sp. xm-d-579]NRP38158.1 Sporulation initiation phosphotransferase F [Marinobacterium sp. xm-a-121]NRP46941.1 Sporulation initiation phosphotransferase F [Marinobacterium sp. xm-d-543]NRP53079.1 Sporulation initiation phosphotransferase F [Marinobacterium sp. xm-v-242]
MKTLSTGEIAKLCDVNLRTVIRWIERGALKGFKLPGRGNNRVRVEDFLAFLVEHEIPIPAELQEDSRKVLVVDDEPAIARALQRVLRKHGLVAEVAADGFQAGTKLMKDRPILVTLDLSMPGLSGYDVLSFVRETPEIASTKILVISALGSEALQKAIDLGADAILNKPFDNHELVEVINKLVGTAAKAEDI